MKQMEYVIEFILDLLVDGTIEILPNKKVPKWIRYPLGIFVGLFMFAVIIGIFVLGILIFGESLIAGILMLALGFVLLVCAIYKTVKIIRQM